MANEYRGSTPQHRGPVLGDERPAQRDRALRDIGAITNLIRLTPTGTDVSGGEGAFYNFGPVDKSNVGRYRCVRQTAASATADPLADYGYVDFDIIEASAGVFTATVTGIFSVEGGTATNDAADTDTLQSAAILTTAIDPDIGGTGSDSRATIFVADADAVSEGASAGYAGWAVGDLILLDAQEADDHVFSLQRLT